jgi:hypothetical protein
VEEVVEVLEVEVEQVDIELHFQVEQNYITRWILSSNSWSRRSWIPPPASGGSW